MSGLEEEVEKEGIHIHSEESHDNPLLFMIIPGLIACVEETTRYAGYILILGAVGQPLIEATARVYQAIRGYRQN